MVQLSHPYMTTGKTIALTRWTFVGKVMSLLFNMLSRLVITFLPRVSVLDFLRIGRSEDLPAIPVRVLSSGPRFLGKSERGESP